MEPILLWLRENWGYVVPSAFIVIGWIVTFRWLFNVQKRIHTFAEHLARLEGRMNQEKDGQ